MTQIYKINAILFKNLKFTITIANVQAILKQTTKIHIQYQMNIHGHVTHTALSLDTESQENVFNSPILNCNCPTGLVR